MDLGASSIVGYIAIRPQRTRNVPWWWCYGPLKIWTLTYINNYMEPLGSDELKVAYERIKNGEFDPPGFIPDCTRSEPEPENT
jgi:hypothetical protein